MLHMSIFLLSEAEVDIGGNGGGRNTSTYVVKQRIMKMSACALLGRAMSP